MKKLAISVGSFIVRPRMDNLGYPSVTGYLAKGFKVEAYDPRRDVHEEYLTVQDKNFSHYQLAVVADASKKEVMLKVLKGRTLPSKSNREGDKYMGSTIHCDKHHDFRKDVRFTGIVDSYPVKTISIRSILEKHDEIEELHLVCEGEEMPILLGTPIELLLKCRVIVPCFLWQYSHLHQTEKMEKECLVKMSKYYVVKQIQGTRRFSLERKDEVAK